MLFQAVEKFFSNTGSTAERFDAAEKGHLRIAERAPSPDHPHREYFRIDTEVLVRYWPLECPSATSLDRLQKVNLSGSGVRFQVSVPLALKQPVGLEITLPGPEPVVLRCSGRVVRFEEDERGRRQAAVGFTVISPRDRERIIGYCFAEQRRILRQRVRVDG
ncbi:hypothetical protein DESUT3_36650 [Desulfuromonas versatilis]|uniref:PilZ domain-containing protein n=1 Tax=Desulfuromonas versatilis TaxID=2802975 RepID=A0ABM8HUJ5_9BACT|nr:PilZ domain-containing protein [Desulfuromonas versatilis]BCR06596.1 hypothetical protein DESUT3_36650 [Desulfuromonas versatilis]